MPSQSDKISYKSPIYLQLREVIRKKIDEGEYLPGTSIPSENELAATYGITRLTVRNAISKLVNEGRLQRIKGKGVYVVPERLSRDLDKLGGFVQVARDKHSSTNSRILARARRKAGDKYAGIFDIQPQDTLFYIKRVTYSGDNPVSLDEIHIPADIIPNFDEIDLSVFSLYQAYEFSGIQVAHAYQTLDLTCLEKNDARTLNLVPNVAVMLFECTSYDENERVVEFTRTFARGDQCDFHVRFHE